MGRAGRHQRVAAAAPPRQRLQQGAAAVRGAALAARQRHLLVGVRIARAHYEDAAIEEVSSQTEFMLLVVRGEQRPKAAPPSMIKLLKLLHILTISSLKLPLLFPLSYPKIAGNCLLRRASLPPVHLSP